MKPKAIIFFLTLFSSISLLNAQQKRIITTEISYFIDTGNSYTPETIDTNNFKPTPKNLTVNNPKGTIWALLSFNPENKETWPSYTLDLGQESISLAQVYIKKSGKWIYYGQTGRKLKLEYMQIGYMRQAVSVNEKSFEEKEPTHEILVKIEPVYGNTIVFHLWDTSTYWKRIIIVTIIHTVITSIFISISFMSLIYGFLFLNKSVLLLSSISIIFVLLQLQQTGAGPAFMWNIISRNLPSSDYICFFLKRIIIAATALFYCFSINLKQNSRLAKFYKVTITAILSLIILDFLVNIISKSQGFIFYSFYSMLITVNLLFLILNIVYNIKEKGFFSYNITSWNFVFLFVLSSSIIKVIRAVTGNTIFPIFQSDIYFSNYFIFMFFLFPLLFTTAFRIRIRFKDLYKKMEFLEKKHNESIRNTNFFIGVINQLLEMNTMAITGLNMPELKFDSPGNKEIKNLIQYNLVRTQAYLNTSLSLKLNEKINESNIKLKEIFNGCMDSITIIARRKNIEINMQTTIADNDYIRINLFMLQLIFSNLAISIIQLSKRNTTLNIFLTYNDSKLIYIIQNEMEEEEHKSIKKILAKYMDPDLDEELILAGDKTDTNDFDIVQRVCNLYGGKLSVNFSNKGCIFNSFITAKRLKPSETGDIEYQEYLYKPEKNEDTDTISIKQPFAYLKNEPISFFIAESNTTNSIYFKNTLQDFGDIATSENGYEAWNHLETASTLPDIIISEYNLPLVSGTELFYKCSQSFYLQYIPFIIILQSTDRDKIQELYAKGISACLVKPFTSVDLFNTISSILSTTYKAKHSILNQINKIVIKKNTKDNNQFIDIAQSNNAPNNILSNTNLSPREKQIVLLISVGKTDKEIAEELNISPATVATHNKNIFKKLSVHSRIELIKKVQ